MSCYVNIDRLPLEIPFVGNIFGCNKFFSLKTNNLKYIPIFTFIKLSLLQLMKTASDSSIDQSQFFFKSVPRNVKVKPLFRQ